MVVVLQAPLAGVRAQHAEGAGSLDLAPADDEAHRADKRLHGLVFGGFVLLVGLIRAELPYLAVFCEVVVVMLARGSSITENS